MDDLYHSVDDETIEKGLAIVSKVMYIFPISTGYRCDSASCNGLISSDDIGNMNGFVYVAKDDIREEWKVKRISKKLQATITELVKSQVETLSMYFQGDVYGVIIEDENGDQVDSCFGFYGYDYALERAKEMLSNAIDQG